MNGVSSDLRTRDKIIGRISEGPQHAFWKFFWGAFPTTWPNAHECRGDDGGE